MTGIEPALSGWEAEDIQERFTASHLGSRGAESRGSVTGLVIAGGASGALAYHELVREHVAADRLLLETVDEIEDTVGDDFWARSNGRQRRDGVSIDDYAMTIVEVEQIGESVAVSISETYTSEWDREGNPLDAPTAQDDRTEFIVSHEDGAWLVDDGFWE